MSEWKKYFLEELLEVRYGKDHKKLSDGKIPAYGSGGIMRFVDTAICNEVSILIPRKGSLNNIFYLDKPFWTVDTMFWTKLKSNKVDPKFLFYQLTTINYLAMNVGSAVPSMTVPILNKIELSVPDIKTQNRIASILSSIDEAIELNQQTNKTLEEIAQTLFAEMCLPKDEIKKGWKKQKIGEHIETISSTHKMKQEKIIFLNTSDILEGEFLTSEYSVVATLPGQAKKSIKRNDILYSEIRPANKRFAFVNFDADDYVVSTKLMVLRSKGIINPYFIYCFLTNREVINQLQHLAESRSGTFPQITFTQLKEMEFVLPDKNSLEKLTKTIQSIYESIFSTSKETQTLIKLRDSLLPKLMNREINVSQKTSIATV